MDAIEALSRCVHASIDGRKANDGGRAMAILQ
jgi:hypothetical protein